MALLRQYLRIYTHPQLLVILILGVMSGLPFLLTLSTLSFWLAESGVSKTTIGLFMLVGIPYSLKFLWAPVLDQFRIPYFTRQFGRRRSWALVSQAGLFLSLFGLAHSDPTQAIALTAISAFFVSFFSASQDIIIDTYRIESLGADNQGAGAAVEAIGFRFGMLASGAGALYLAHVFTWKMAYLTMAVGVILSMIVVCCISEPRASKITPLDVYPKKPMTFRQQLNALFIVPWLQLPQKRELIYLLGFIFCFRIGDTVLNAMCAPFLCDLGFSKIEFASVTKVFGISLMVFGGLIGGIIIHQLGVLQATVMCIVLQGISCLMFVIQSMTGYHLSILMITVGVESFCSGLVATVFISYLSSFCRHPYTATHFTLLYSFASLCRIATSALAGLAADYITWTVLFLITGAFIFPAVYMIIKIAQLGEQNSIALPERRVRRSG